MACSTCSHTMQSIADGTFWCPRCGTFSQGEQVPPRLVEHVAGFLHLFGPFLREIEENASYAQIGCGVQSPIPPDDIRWRRIGLLRVAVADLLEATKYADKEDV